jgi:hypothetical protein
MRKHVPPAFKFVVLGMKIGFAVLILAAAAAYQHADAFTAVRIGRTSDSTWTMTAIHGSINSCSRGKISSVGLKMTARTINARGMRRPENVEGNFFVRSLPSQPHALCLLHHLLRPNLLFFLLLLLIFLFLFLLLFPAARSLGFHPFSLSPLSPSLLPSLSVLRVPHSLRVSLSPTRCCFYASLNIRWTRPASTATHAGGCRRASPGKTTNPQ